MSEGQKNKEKAGNITLGPFVNMKKRLYKVKTIKE